MSKFKVGTKVISKMNDWTRGRAGTVIEVLGGYEYLVQFYDKDAKGRGHGAQRACWYIKPQDMKLAPASDTLTIGTPNLATDLSLGNQCRKILAHLLETGEITNLASMMVYHVSRLSDVILKLRRAGYEIETVMKEDGVGGKYASYQLQRKRALAA